MGQDGNTIEIEIDAAATQAAAKTAGEANAKLEEFNNALKLFRDNVGTISKTTDSVAGKIGDFNTLLQTFSDKLTENLANMQTRVVAKVEPHLERELENLVNRVTNKVEAKYKPDTESRSRSEAKAGAGAVSTGTPGGKRISVASPPGDRPDALLKEQLVKSNERIVDKMGNVVGGALKTTSKTQTSRFEFGQETNAAGELVDIRREIVDEVKTITKTNFVDPYGKDTTLRGQDRKTAELFSMLGPEGLAKVENAPEVRLKDTFYGSISDALDKSLEKGFSGIEQYVPEMMRGAEKNIWKPYEKQLKQNEKTAQAATVAEKDRGLAIRKEITGALIGLHVMKVVSQYSAVFNAGFMQIAAAMGHLLNNLLLPMMPMFTQVAQFLHFLANVLAMLPMPVRQLIGALVMWKGISMLVASMPLKDIKDGFAGIKEVMQGADSGIKKFWALLRAFVDFMNSGQGRGAVSWIGGGVRKILKRAGGGPVGGGEEYLVGEEGPEIFVPSYASDEFRKHLDKIASRYPTAAKALDPQIWGMSEKDKPGRYEEFGITTNKPAIAVRKDIMRGDAGDLFKDDVEAGFHPEGSESGYSALWHEFGHHLKKSIEKGLYGDGVKSEFERFKQSVKPGKDVSIYGWGDDDEGFAEAFVAKHFSSPEYNAKSPYISKLSEILEKIKYRALGGPVLGHGAYIVGEKGPEIFVPKTSGTIVPNHKIGRAGGGDVEGAPFGGDIMGNLGAGLGVGGLAYMLTGSPLLAAGLGAGAGFLGPQGIANMIGSAVSSDIGANMIASLNVMTGMISSILAPLAPIMGVVGALLGVVTGARAAGGGGGGDRTAETVAKFGNEQLKTTGKMSYGIQNATAMSGRGINKILSMILIRLGNCLYVAPCKPDSFATGTTTTTTTLINTITALPAAISVAITAALAALAGTITYTILTKGEIPTIVPISTTITYDIVTKGTVPEAINKTATITYNIVKNGTEPIATSVTAYIEYVIKTTGSPPTLENLVAWIEAKFGPIAPEEWARLKELVLAKSTADPPKLVVTADGKVKVEGEVTKIEDRVPTEEKVIKDVKAKVAQVIDGIADPAEKTIREATAEVKELKDAVDPAKKVIKQVVGGVEEVADNVDPAKKVIRKFTAEVSNINTPTGTDLTIQPKIDETFLRSELERVWKAIEDTRKQLMQDTVEYGSEEWKRLTDEIARYRFDAKDIQLRIESIRDPAGRPITDMVLDFYGNLVSIDRTLMLGDTVVDVTGEIWRVTSKTGATYKLENLEGVIREISLPDTVVKEVKTRFEGEFAKDGGVSVPLTADTKNLDPRKIVEGLNWKSAGQFAGDMLMFGVLLGAQEFAKTGKIDFVKLVGGLTLGTAGFAIGEKIIGGVANYIGGAGAKALVAKAFTGFGIFLAGQVGGDVAKYFIDSIKNGVANFSGDLGQIQFNDNVILESARRLGQSFGVALDEWMATNLHVTIPDTAWQSIGAILTKAGELTVTPGLPLTNLFAEFISKLQTTLSGGVPVDVRIDVESVTSVVNAVRETAMGTPISGGASVPGETVGECPQGQYWDRALQACAPIQGSVIPSHAGGGRVTPYVPNLVGELGPELFVPDSAPLSGGGNRQATNVTNNFTFNVTTNNPKELTDTVMKQLKLELARVKM